MSRKSSQRLLTAVVFLVFTQLSCITLDSLMCFANGGKWVPTSFHKDTGLLDQPAYCDQSDSPESSSQEELMAQDPVEITAGPWRFFNDSSETNALYDIKFEPDGSCYVPGDTIVYGGKYTVDGNQIEIELYRRFTATSTDPDGTEHSAEVEWSEWFHMTRIGNTMTGTWEVENWMFSYDKGLEMRGNRINGDSIFSRPERPEDPG